MYIKPKIGFLTVFHPFEEGADKAQELHNSCLKSLNKLDIDIINHKNPVSEASESAVVGEHFRKKNVDAVVILLATWSSDNLLLDLTAVCEVPIINWGLEDINSGSMCGAQQFNAVLKELEYPCTFVYKNNNLSLINMYKYFISVAMVNALKMTKFGLIGSRTQGMSEVICDEFSVRDVFGSRIVSIGLDIFKRSVESQNTNDYRSVLEEIKTNIRNINVTDEELEHAIKNYAALKEFIEEQELDGVTIECYPNYMGEVCLGFSLLADEGYVGACEGDINSAILMWIMQNLSKSPVNHIDPLYLYDEDDSIVGSHCGCTSVFLADDLDAVEISHVRLADKGVCMMYSCKPGAVTMANLIGRKGTYRMAVITGNAIRTERAFPGTPVRVQLPFSNQAFLDLVEIGGFGHHWVVAYGDISTELLKLGDLLEISTLYFNNQV
ncbi:MAG: hypothetical protein GF364_05325 [Candidatus Lokiarchaeota archaeon]|nr:hypothetical protein [Candidatus Lokiarchaeota archaeon]